MAKYGKTPWGQEWLNALTHIDSANRLPRGRSYASNGYVESVFISENKINALVHGSRPKPYKVEIYVPVFSENEKKILTEFIQKNPLYLSQLLNKQLPVEILTDAAKNGIKIFPKKWNDLQMNCSCPDSAVPCKHLAAVIYILANEIDKNPFIVFNLHNFDVLNSLKKEKHEKLKKSSEYQEIISYRQFLTETKPDFSNWNFNEELYKSLDFSVVRDNKTIILSLLKPAPLFHVTDFKTIINAVYSDTLIGTKFFVNQLQNNSDSGKYQHNLEKIRKIKIEIRNTFTSPKITYFSEHGILAEPSDISYFIKILKSIEEKKVTDYCPDVIALRSAFLFTLELILNYGYIPQIFRIDDNTYKIRWIPAIIDDEVKIVFNSVSELLSPDIIQILISDEKGNASVHFQTKEEQLLTICSLLINQIMSQYIDQVMNTKKITPFDKVFSLFFKNEPIVFSKFFELETPASIHQWLSKFHISYKETVPVLKFTENDNFFELEIFIENKNTILSEPLHLKQFLESEKNESKRLNVLKDLALLSESFPEIQGIINTGGNQKLAFDSEQFVDILMKTIPSVRLFGITILMPKSLKTLMKPQVSLKLTKNQAEKSASFLKLDSLLDFKWQIAVGDLFLDADEFKNLVKNMAGIVKIKDQFVLIKKDDIDKILKNLSNPPKLNSADLLKSALTREYQDAKISISDDVKTLIESLTQGESTSLPKKLKADLRPYQIRGYEWLVKNSKVGFGSIIADDMGLGKTLQVIAALLKFKQEGFMKKKKSLVVVPTTLITNWKKEIERFAPELNIFIYHGQNRVFEPEDADLIITSYGTLRSDIKIFSDIHWHAAVIDEAQNIKNQNTEQTKAVKQLKADVRIAMTGTPVENRLSEYWSIFDFTNKGFLGNQKYFADEFATPIQVYKNHSKLEKFMKITTPFVLRRLKSDKSIIGDLPEKIENNQYCSLTKEQAGLYQGVLNNIMDEIKQSEGINRRGLVLKLITSLKQISNHPNHFLKKAEAKPELSGKSELLFSILENILENDEKVLIFTQYKEMGDLLSEMVENILDTKALFLHGGLSRKNRDEMVEDFQTKKNYKIFILSLKAGGTGLNLTAASNVIHYDLWWNPAVEAQATDRAYRIGQTSNVMVYRLLTKGTFEEKIDDMINSKKDLAKMTVASGEKWIGELDNDQLTNIFKLD